MDAQNAVEAASTKPHASATSPSMSSRPPPDTDRSKSSSSALTKTPALSRQPPPSKDAKAPLSKVLSSLPTSSAASTQAPTKDSSKGSAVTVTAPSTSKDAKSTAPRDKQEDDKGSTDGNSEAETIVLSKDGSPSKPRSHKVIKHEDKRNGDSAPPAATHTDHATPARKHNADKKDGPSDKGDKPPASASAKETGTLRGGNAKVSAVQRIKRSQEKQQSHLAAKEASSSLSSAPASPPRSRQHSTNPHSGSDSDRGRLAKSPRTSLSSKDKLRPPEKLVPYKRKAPKPDSDDEAESRKVRRQRAPSDGASHLSAKTGKEQPLHRSHSGSKQSSSRAHGESSHNRSLSPQPRPHRRSLSTQLSSQSNSLGMKKKRVPAPLQSTDYHSDDSSASGSPRMRNSKLRSLTTPATAESGVSPVKMGPHKKHLDAHGQTFLARACARGEYDLAKQRLGERPEDLNVADFAGNTPLQIAALNGYGDIVKLLIEAGCNLDCVNYDRDTPLLDAVDNGHLEVVKLLLDAGVNPRKANLSGEEPLDRVSDDVDNAAEIRKVLVEAKKKLEGRRLTSEEHRHTSEERRHEHDEHRVSHGPESPRRSPAPSASHAIASGRRAGTVRATKTSNHLLYMPMDDKTLRMAAGRGDQETVTRILQVREVFDDAESMVAAARGGHDMVMNLLLALGGANPDPPPVSSVPPEHATPMLAAIGQENLNVIQLLLEQSAFNPTQRFRGNTYYEIARQRAGPNWKEEEDMLKNAYDKYKRLHGGKDSKLRSPARKDGESRKAGRSDTREDSSRAAMAKLSSPLLERMKKISTKFPANGSSTSPREEKPIQKRTETSASHADGKTSPKRSSSGLTHTKHRRDDRSSITSGPDRDTPPPSKQVAKSRKADAESIAVSSEGETVKPRRKLISGRELKDEKEKQRRMSLASINTAHDDTPSDKARVEKHRDRDRDRARQLKKEESKESASGSVEGSGKRHRMSETPPRLGSSDKDATEAPIKRRRLDGDGSNGNSSKEKKASKSSNSPDTISSKPSGATSSRDATASSKASQRRRDEEDRKSATAPLKAKRREPSSDRARKDSSKSSSVVIEKSIHVKSEDVDVEMSDARPYVRVPGGSGSAPMTADAELRNQREKEDEKKRLAEAEVQAAEAKKKKEEEAQRRHQEEEAKRKKEEEELKREEEERKRKEEKERKKLEEEERRRKEEERKRKEEERKRKEEEERKRREAEEEKRRVEEEERKRKEDEQRKKREEEERLRQEQLEREAAEEARRKREEEQRKERERKEQERREQERILAEKEAEELRRKQLEEEERIRIDKLPPLLRWLSTCPNPKLASVAKLFHELQGVRYDCINANATGSPEGREQWLLNVQVALVLGEKDFELSQYPAWQRLPASDVAKTAIWRLEADRYALTEPDLYDMGRQLPGYYGAADPNAMRYFVVEQLRRKAREQFQAMSMFFVKVSDVMSIIPSIPHLRGIQLDVVYRELPEDIAMLKALRVPQRWKNDPDANPDVYPFAPGKKYYVDGKKVKEDQPNFTTSTRTPPPEIRVPRRGLHAVRVEDPEFLHLCEEQRIDPVTIPSYRKYESQKQPNGVAHAAKPAPGNKVNGRASLPPINGDGHAAAHAALQHLANGVNGTRGS